MRWFSVCLIGALFFGALATNDHVSAGIFGGNAELGIIKQSENNFLIVAPDGEVIDPDTLRMTAARVAKLLNFSYFLIDMPVEKSAQKAKSAKSVTPDTASAEPEAEAPKPLTSVNVYFYNSPRQRNGNTTIAVTDIIPADTGTSAAPVVEKAPASTADEPTVEKKPKKAAKVETQPQDQPAPVIEKTSAPLADAPTVEKKPKKAAKVETQPQDQPAPAIQNTPVKEKLTIDQVLAPVGYQNSGSRTVKPSAKSAPALVEPKLPAVETESGAEKKETRRRKKFYPPSDDGSILPNNAPTKELGDLFN